MDMEAEEIKDKYSQREQLESQQYSESTKTQSLSSHVDEYKKFFINSNSKGHSNFHQVVRLQVSISFFTFELTILNLEEFSPSKQNLSLIGRGGYSEIFKLPFSVQCSQINIAIKSISSKENQKQQFGNVFQRIVVEFCFSKLFSVLQVGPYIPALFGFDLIIYKDFVEFAIQLCEKPKSSHTQDLIDGLATLHKLSIIHGDIKPQNIMWSEKYEKNVFLDFGLSKAINEKIGECTLTYFFGTYHFCGEQMKSIFCSSMFGWIDLYYNDVYGLKKSFAFISNEYQKRNKERDKAMKKDYICLILNLKIISLVFEGDVVGMRDFIKCYPSLTILELTIRFFQEMDYNAVYGRILKMLTDSYYFEQKLKKKIVKFSKIQSLQFLRTEADKDVEQILKRMNKLNNANENSVNDIMLFFLIFYEEDITPNAQKKCLELQKFLMEMDIGVGYWQSLVEYTNNVYVNLFNLQKIYEVLKQKLLILEWKKANNFDCRIFVKSKQIAQVVLQKYGVDLFELKNQSDKKQKQKVQFERNFQQFPFLDILKDLKIEIKMAKENKRSLNFEGFKKKYPNESFQSLKKVIFLIQEALKVENDVNIDYESIVKYLENFKFFDAALKTKSLFKKRHQILQKELSKFSTNHVSYEKNFYRKIISLTFSCYHCLQACSHDQIQFLINKKQMNLQYFEGEMNQIYEMAYRFKSQKIYETLFEVLDKISKNFYAVSTMEIYVGYSRIIFGIFVKILDEISLKACSFLAALTINNLLNYILIPFPDSGNVIQHVLSQQDYNLKDIDVSDYYKYNYIKQRIVLYKKVGKKNESQYYPMYQLYKQLVYGEKDLNVFRHHRIPELIDCIMLACFVKCDPRISVLELCSYSIKVVIQARRHQLLQSLFLSISTYYSIVSVEYKDEFFEYGMGKIKQTNDIGSVFEYNWSLYYGLDCLFYYFFQRVKICWQENLWVYQKLMKFYKQDCQGFCMNYSNSVVLFLVFFKNYSKNKYKISKLFVWDCLKMVSFMIGKCNFCVKRNFEKLMVHFVRQFSLDCLIEYEQRKDLLSKVRYLRCQKDYPLLLETKEHFIQKIKAIKKVRIRSGLRDRIDSIYENKKKGNVRMINNSYLNQQVREQYLSISE